MHQLNIADGDIEPRGHNKLYIGFAYLLGNSMPDIS